MIDVLLINPNEHAEEIVHALSAYNLTYIIVTTSGSMFPYGNNLHVLDLNTNPWLKDEKFKSAIAWGKKGQQFLDGITALGQVVLSNKNVEDRIEQLLLAPLNEELSTVYNFVLFNNHYVVLDAFVFKDNRWKILKNHNLKFYKDRLAVSISFLKSMGVQNGPCKIFVTAQGKTYLQLSYKTTKPSARKFVDIWPIILSSEYPAIEFAAWSTNTGLSDDEFYLANDL